MRSQVQIVSLGSFWNTGGREGMSCPVKHEYLESKESYV